VTDKHVIQVGSAAPALTLPAVNREGSVTLADYRGRQPVLLGLFRGLHCPFCRRHLVQFGALAPKLQALGVEVVGVINTPLERARLYIRHRPSPVLLLADPEAASHRAFGVPAPEVAPRDAGGRSEWPWRETLERLMSTRVNPNGEMPEPIALFEVNEQLNRQDGFQMTEADQHTQQAHGTQLIGHFVIDRDGVVRWRYLEAERRPEDIGTLPTEANFLAAAGTVAG
jgi:peroxiredoxin